MPIVTSEDIVAYQQNFFKGVDGQMLPGNQTPGNIPIGLWRNLTPNDRNDVEMVIRLAKTMDIYKKLYAIAPKREVPSMHYPHRYFDEVSDYIPFVLKNPSGIDKTIPVVSWVASNPLIVTIGVPNDVPIQKNSMLTFPQIFCITGTDTGHMSVAEAKTVLTNGAIKYSPFYYNAINAAENSIASLYGAPMTAIVQNVGTNDSAETGKKTATLKILGYDNELIDFVINGVADNRSAAASPIAPVAAPGVTLAMLFGNATNRNIGGGILNSVSGTNFSASAAYASLVPYDASSNLQTSATKLPPVRIALDSVYTGSDERKALVNRSPKIRYESVQRYREFMSASIQTGFDIPLAHNTRRAQADQTLLLLLNKINNSLFSNVKSIEIDDNGEMQYTFDGLIQRFPSKTENSETLTLSSDGYQNYLTINRVFRKFFDLGQRSSVAVAFCGSRFIEAINRVLVSQSRSYEMYDMRAWYGFNVQELRMSGAGGIVHLFPMRYLDDFGSSGIALVFDPGTDTYPTIRITELAGDPFRVVRHPRDIVKDRESAEFRGTIGLEGLLDRAMRVQIS